MSNVLFCYGKEHPETSYRQVCFVWCVCMHNAWVVRLCKEMVEFVGVFFL